MNVRTERIDTPDGHHVIGIITGPSGQEYAAGGGGIYGRYVIGYPTTDGRLQDWTGADLGTWTVVSSWPAIFHGQRSWQGERVYSAHAVINGARYTGRGFGPGMVWRGRMVARDVARIGRAVETLAQMCATSKGA